MFDRFYYSIVNCILSYKYRDILKKNVFKVFIHTPGRGIYLEQCKIYAPGLELASLRILKVTIKLLAIALGLFSRVPPRNFFYIVLNILEI